MSEELSDTVLIVNKRGLHARAAAKFVKEVALFDAEIIVTKDNNSANGASIMGLLMLGASIHTEITIYSTGIKADEALKSLSDLVNRGFDEE